MDKSGRVNFSLRASPSIIISRSCYQGSFGGQLPHFSNSDFAILENRIDKFGSDSGDDGSLVITLLLKEPIIAYDAHLLTSPYSALEAAPLIPENQIPYATQYENGF